MTTASYDGQSITIGSRRIWLVSGSIHYARTPHQLWPDRIRAAKQAGLNCIDTPVFWGIHEPQPGEFNFEGDYDLGRFVQAVGQQGLYCTLRLGPYIGADWDMGGMPVWLHRIPAVKWRQANGPFLEACARYLGAVLEQVKDYQVNAVAAGDTPSQRPIVMMQAESHWVCDHPAQAQAYLAELVRYLREHGCTVPICDTHNLWSRVEGIVATWNGSHQFSADLRQLSLVQPHAPRIVSEYPSAQAETWNQPSDVAADPAAHQVRLASILAMGAQFNLSTFHGGTNFGFHGGRRAASSFDFITTRYHHDAPLSEAGQRGPLYRAVKRIGVFASQFAQLFAYLEPHHPHASITPDAEAQGLAVIHQRGSHGEVVFLIKPSKDKITHTQILLPNGLTLNIPLGDEPVAWFVLNASLGGVATLDYTNLCPWVFLNKRMLVLFGPADAQGVVSINGAPLYLKVSRGQTPVIKQHEGLTVAVLNPRQVDSAYIGASGLVVGAGGIDDRDNPIALPGRSRATVISPEGQSRQRAAKAVKPPTAPRLGEWAQATMESMITGECDQYEPIDGPASLESLGCDHGYGWYRLDLPSSNRAGKALFPQSGDRLHLYRSGRLGAIIGDGPAAESGPVNLRPTGRVVLLADNLGRFCDGWRMTEPKGLFGHGYTVDPVKLSPPKMIQAKAPDLFSLDAFVPFARLGDQPISDALLWKVKPTGKKPMIIELDQLPWRAMWLVNDEPVGMYDPGLSGGRARWVLRVGEQIRAGQNELKLALFGKIQDDTPGARPPTLSFLNKHVKIYRVSRNLTDKASWAFARWGLPAQEAFRPVRRGGVAQPCWYRGQFKVSHADTPLWLCPVGMTKGQIYINGHNAGRYFVATAQGDPVGPQTQYYLPEPWLHTDRPNELLLFDEHGHHPGKCKLTHQEEAGPLETSPQAAQQTSLAG